VAAIVARRRRHAAPATSLPDCELFSFLAAQRQV
jgi:hypothetical protein